MRNPLVEGITVPDPALIEDWLAREPSVALKNLKLKSEHSSSF